MTEFKVGDRVRVRSIRATTVLASRSRNGTVVMVNRNLGGGTVLSYQVCLDADTAKPGLSTHAILQPEDLEPVPEEDSP